MINLLTKLQLRRSSFSFFSGSFIVFSRSPPFSIFPQYIARIGTTLEGSSRPPYTLQRICEVILRPRDTYYNLKKYLFAIDKVPLFLEKVGFVVFFSHFFLQKVGHCQLHHSSVDRTRIHCTTQKPPKSTKRNHRTS